MIDILRPAREIITELNRLESKYTKTLVHGIGKIQNVSLDRFHWNFKIKLDNEILINCSIHKEEDENTYMYFEDGDIIEFSGEVKTYLRGLFPRYNVQSIYLYDAKLSDEERLFSEVLMWNVKVVERNILGKVAVTVKEGIKDSEIACISDLQETENHWVYGHLIRREKDVILQLDKIME